MSVVHIDASGPGGRPYTTICACFQGPLGEQNSPIFVERLEPMSPIEAEYRALILALNKAQLANCRQLHVYTDCRVVALQIHQHGKVRSELLKPLYEIALELIQRFDLVVVQYIPRELNRQADWYAANGLPEEIP